MDSLCGTKEKRNRKKVNKGQGQEALQVVHPLVPAQVPVLAPALAPLQALTNRESEEEMGTQVEVINY